VFACRNMTMSAFANVIPSMRGASGHLFNYRVVDRTGLRGAWNFNIRRSMRMPGPPGLVEGRRSGMRSISIPCG
jgi:uncharacterized protein (TIGR03435 family)